MGWVVGLPGNSYKPITASDKVYHGRWFSPGTPASSTTKTGRHDIAEILLGVALNTKNQSNLKNIPCLNEINSIMCITI